MAVRLGRTRLLDVWLRPGEVNLNPANMRTMPCFSPCPPQCITPVADGPGGRAPGAANSRTPKAAADQFRRLRFQASGISPSSRTHIFSALRGTSDGAML